MNDHGSVNWGSRCSLDSQCLLAAICFGGQISPTSWTFWAVPGLLRALEIAKVEPPRGLNTV